MKSPAAIARICAGGARGARAAGNRQGTRYECTGSLGRMPSGCWRDLIAGRFPDARGRFGPFGGRYVPETLIPALERLERGVREHLHARRRFRRELAGQLQQLGGPPHGAHLRRATLGALGREGVAQARGSRAHRCAQDQQRDRPGAAGAAPRRASASSRRPAPGQHGVASAAACARLGLPCTVYMGEVDMERQAPNVGRMRLLGAHGGAGHQRRSHAARGDRRGDARLGGRSDRHLLSARLGGRPASLSVPGARAAGGHRPRGARADARGAPARCRMRSSPASAAARTPSVPSTPSCRDAAVEIIGVEAGGRGRGLGENAATARATAAPACCTAAIRMLLQDGDGQIQETHSVSAGLDYPGVGPEHALLAAIGRVHYEHRERCRGARRGARC